MDGVDEFGDLRRRVAELERQVAALQGRPLGHRDAAAVPSGDPSNEATVSAAVRALVAEGKMIEAIKLHRNDTGSSLRDAKAAVERLSGLSGR